MQNHGLGMKYDKMCEDGRPVGAGGAGDATAPTDFGKSVNPISARRHFMPTTLILASRIFRPSYSPGYLVCTTKNPPNTSQLIRPICSNRPKHLGYY